MKILLSRESLRADFSCRHNRNNVFPALFRAMPGYLLTVMALVVSFVVCVQLPRG